MNWPNCAWSPSSYAFNGDSFSCARPKGHQGAHANESYDRTMDDDKPVRSFDGGATRDSETNKLDPEGFLNPLVLDTFYRYMDKHRRMSDGTLRGSDNWQAGMPQDVYVKSLARHWHDVWLLHRGYEVARPENGEVPTMIDSLCGLLFNAQGMMLEVLKEKSW